MAYEFVLLSLCFLIEYHFRDLAMLDFLAVINICEKMESEKYMRERGKKRAKLTKMNIF